MRKSVGSIATPDQIYFSNSLPKTKSSRVARRILKAIVEEARIGDLSTLEDETVVEEVIRRYHEKEKDKVGTGPLGR